MSKTLKDVFDLFEGVLSEEEINTSNLLADISNQIIKQRLKMGMNQKEFAQFLGVSQGMVSKWESEQYNFTIEALARICYKLNLDLKVSVNQKNIKGKEPQKPIFNHSTVSSYHLTSYDVSR